MRVRICFWAEEPRRNVEQSGMRRLTSQDSGRPEEWINAEGTGGREACRVTVLIVGPEQGSGDAEGGWERERLRRTWPPITHRMRQ